MTEFCFVHLRKAYWLAPNFDFGSYIRVERELWALFPETDGKRVSVVPFGLSASLAVSAHDDGSSLCPEEAYVLMPYPDGKMKPMRMTMVRRINLEEYRFAYHTLGRLKEMLPGLDYVNRSLNADIYGEEIQELMQSRSWQGGD